MTKEELYEYVESTLEDLKEKVDIKSDSPEEFAFYEHLIDTLESTSCCLIGTDLSQGFCKQQFDNICKRILDKDETVADDIEVLTMAVLLDFRKRTKALREKKEGKTNENN